MLIFFIYRKGSVAAITQMCDKEAYRNPLAQNRFRVAHDAIVLNLKREPQRQLSDASIYGRATNDAESG